MRKYKIIKFGMIWNTVKIGIGKVEGSDWAKICAAKLDESQIVLPLSGECFMDFYFGTSRL